MVLAVIGCRRLLKDQPDTNASLEKSNQKISHQHRKMATSTQQIAAAVLVASCAYSVLGFAPPSSHVRSGINTALNVAVDPMTVTTKEYNEICGTVLTEDEMLQKYDQTPHLYTKHVEVVEDLAPLAGEMVDKIVSLWFEKSFLSWELFYEPFGFSRLVA